MFVAYPLKVHDISTTSQDGPQLQGTIVPLQIRGDLHQLSYHMLS